jgi:hypothetical protein
VSTDREWTNLVRSWIQTDEHESADRVLGAVFDRLDTTPQRRPLWRARRNEPMNGPFKLVAAGTVAVLVAATALGIYLTRPTVGPVASSSPSLAPSSPLPSLSTGPTTAAVRAPFIVFNLSDGRFDTPDDLWAMRADGAGAQLIHHPSGPAFLAFGNHAWSQDGKKLLLVISDVRGVSHVYLADVSDVIGPFVDTGFSTGADTACNDKSGAPAPCQDDHFTFSPDGQRVAFLQSCTYSAPGCGFITILDLGTGERTELGATLRQSKHEGTMGWLAWSPDGSRIAFIMETRPQGQDDIPKSNLWLIDSDGRNLHQVDLAVSRVTAPQWSADGSTIALMSDVADVYTVRPDGTGLQQLTTDGRSSWPEWTPAGQIRFRIGTISEPTMQYRLMDADGANVTELVDLDGLIKAIAPEGLHPVRGDLGPTFLWQPGSSWYENR